MWAIRWDTLSQMSVRQVVSRALRLMRFRFVYPKLANLFFKKGVLGRISVVKLPYLIGESAYAQNCCLVELTGWADRFQKRQFQFLNLPVVDFGRKIHWDHAPQNNRLWQYNLQYGDWAVTLMHAWLATQQADYLEQLIVLLGEWIDQNPIGRTSGWEPYPTSRRLIAWSRLAIGLQGATQWDEFWRSHLEPSLRSQAACLQANLEFDLLNNHLIANYRALAWVGLLFPHWPESKRWQRVGLKGLWAEMARQILPDGVHDERSISYHTIVLQDLLEVWLLARERGVDVPATVEPTLRKMCQFLADMQAPDGGWPLVNDSVQGYPCDPREVLLACGVLFERPDWVTQAGDASKAYAAWLGLDATSVAAMPMLKQLTVYPEAGYAVLRKSAENYLLLDAGEIGPSRLPGHGHADALNIVLYEDGKPRIVDPGVYTYQGGEWRDYFRSTRAHNSVAVDNQDQCVFWGAFRVAYAPKASFTDWQEMSVTGEHNGYERNGVTHRRQVTASATGYEIVDSFEGSGNYQFMLNLQLTPDAQLTIDGLVASAEWPDGYKMRILLAQGAENATVTQEAGWISPSWNIKDAAPRYILRWSATLPMQNHIKLEKISA